MVFRDSLSRPSISIFRAVALPRSDANHQPPELIEGLYVVEVDALLISVPGIQIHGMPLDDPDCFVELDRHIEAADQPLRLHATFRCWIQTGEGDVLA